MLAPVLRHQAGLGERGASALLAVLFLPALLLVVGLVTDAGLLFLSRHLAYHAAELGALAGAQDVDLEALADGRLLLLEPQAAETAAEYVRRNLTAAFPRRAAADLSEIAVRVYNASGDAPLVHAETGRRLVDPTVSVHLQIAVPLYFLRPLARDVTVRVRADASVRTKGS